MRALHSGRVPPKQAPSIPNRAQSWVGEVEVPTTERQVFQEALSFLVEIEAAVPLIVLCPVQQVAGAHSPDGIPRPLEMVNGQVLIG